MVQLEEVKDADLDAPQPGPSLSPTAFDDDADFTDTDSSLSPSPPLSPSLPPQETALERLTALKDMIPPSTRRRIGGTVSALGGLGWSGAVWGGRGLYVLSTGLLLVLVPFAMAYTEEQVMVEQEREMKAREGGVGEISPGAALGKGGV